MKRNDWCSKTIHYIAYVQCVYTEKNDWVKWTHMYESWKQVSSCDTLKVLSAS